MIHKNRIAWLLHYVLILTLVVLSMSAWAAPRAWLVDDEGGAAKLDLTQQTVTQQAGLGLLNIHLSDVAADPVRGNLFVPWGRDPYQVEVLDLKTLARKGRLDFPVTRAPSLDQEVIRGIFPPSGREFYVRWWNAAAGGGQGAFEVATIDAAALRTIGRRTTSPPLESRLYLDPSGSPLYSMETWERAHVDLFTLPGFARTGTIDLEPLIGSGVFGRSIHDFGDGRILLNLNEKAKEADPNSYTLFTFDLATRQASPRIRTGREGRGKLLPRSGRVLFDEVEMWQDPQIGAPRRMTPGRIRVYEMRSGNSLGAITIPVKTMGWYLGVNPAEDTLYYLTDRRTGADSSQFILAIVSLQTFSIVKELAVPIGATRMFFFDE